MLHAHTNVDSSRAPRNSQTSNIYGNARFHHQPPLIWCHSDTNLVSTSPSLAEGDNCSCGGEPSGAQLDFESE